MPEEALEMAGHPQGQAAGQDRLADASPAVDYGRSLQRRREAPFAGMRSSFCRPTKPSLITWTSPSMTGFWKSLGGGGLYLACMQAIRVQQVEHWRGEVHLIAPFGIPHGQPGLSQGQIYGSAAGQGLIKGEGKSGSRSIQYGILHGHHCGYTLSAPAYRPGQPTRRR